MKKLFFLFLLPSSLCAFAFPGEKFAAISPVSAASFCRYQDFLFDPSGSRIVSSLDWRAEPLFFLGAGAAFGTGRLSFSCDFLAGLPSRCGSFFDSDFTADGTKKNFCFFDNFSRLNIRTSASGRFQALSRRGFFAGPELALRYSYDLFLADNGQGYFGSGEYSLSGRDVPWDSEYARKARRVSRISYGLHSLFFFAGAFAEFQCADFIRIGIGSYVCPFAFMYAEDHHFDDTSETDDGYFTYETGFSFFARFRESLSVSVRAGGRAWLTLSADIVFGGLAKGISPDLGLDTGLELFCLDARAFCSVIF